MVASFELAAGSGERASMIVLLRLGADLPQRDDHLPTADTHSFRCRLLLNRAI